MTFEEYQKNDALGLAQLIKKKEIQAAELFDLAVGRAQEANPKINAIVQETYDYGRKMMENLDGMGPFSGLPFLIKDLGIFVKGLPLRSGCRGYKDFVCPEDSELTKRLRKAGFIFMGKTNTPEFGLTPFTEPRLFGPSRNPWNLERSTGGSSGGSAASVAAGIVPLATASDGGGSIRIPASCCGLFGMKPSRGRITLGPQYGDLWEGGVVEGCVSRSVRDTAAYLDAMQGAGVGESYIIEPPERPYLEEVQKDPGSLRIAFNTSTPFGTSPEESCKEAVLNAAKLLADLGHEVEEVELPYRQEDLTQTFITVVYAQTAATLQVLEEYLGRKVGFASDVEPATWVMGRLGKTFSAQEYAYQKLKWAEMTRRIGAFHQKYDLILTSTLGMEPFEIGALQTSAAELRLAKLFLNLGLGSVLKSKLKSLAQKTFSWIPYTAFANMTGQPSMSVPLHWSEKGLPVGVMFSGRVGEEGLLFRLAGQLEKAQPWFDKVPEV